ELTDTGELTDTDVLTTASPITEVESLPLEIPDADATLEADEESLTDQDSAAVSDAEDDAALADSADLTGDEQDDAATLGTNFPITVELDISFLVTDTMTSTVPAMLVLRFAGLPTTTIPISVEVAQLDSALVTVTPLTSTEAISAFLGITTTEDLTGT